MSDTILKLTDAEFENKVIKSDKPILVDFWAEWCGPCKMIAPVLEEVAEEVRRLAQQVERVTNILVNRAPCAASRSMVGVSTIGCPAQPRVS